MAVSRAPIASLQAYKRRMGWTFPWASSLDTDFNFDFNTSFTEDQQRSGSVDYNYGVKDTTWIREAGPASEHAAMCGSPHRLCAARMEPFRQNSKRPWTTLSTRRNVPPWKNWPGCAVAGSHRAPKGRNETGAWWRRGDEY